MTLIHQALCLLVLVVVNAEHHRKCKCGASQKMSKFQQDQRVIQFLMGLNDSYAMMRGSILMKSPLPSISQVYCLLLQEESQREIHASGHFMSDSASLNVNSSSKFNNASIQGTNYSKKSGFDYKKSSLHCNYCKKTGHTIDKCYKIHGSQLTSSSPSPRG